LFLRLAADRPDLVRTLTMTEPPLRSWLAALPGGIDLLAQRTAAILPAKRAVLRGDLEHGARLFIDGMMGDGVFDRLPTSARQRIMDNARLIGAEPTEIDAMESEDITRSEAATIQAPTLLLTGDASPPMFLLVSGNWRATCQTLNTCRYVAPLISCTSCNRRRTMQLFWSS
jgi:non-heme chloroperoxidase